MQTAKCSSMQTQLSRTEALEVVETYEGMLRQLSPTEWASPRGIAIRNDWTAAKARAGVL